MVLMTSYNDNLFLHEEREEDVLTQSGVRIAPRYLGSVLSMGGDYRIQMETLAQHPEENRITQDGSIQIDLAPGFPRFIRPGSVTVKEDFTFTPTLQQYYFDEERHQVSSLSNFGIQTQRTESFRNNFALGLSVPVTPKWTFNSNYRNLLTEYKDPALIDNMTQTVTIGTSYNLLRVTPFAEAETGLIRWGERDSQTYSLSLGAHHTLARRWKMTLQGGLLFFDSQNEGSRDTWTSSLAFLREAHHHSISVGYSKTINPSAGVGRHPPIAQLFHANGMIRINKRKTFTLGGSYALNSSFLETELDTRSYTVGAGMDYRVTQWLKARLQASHFNQDSNTPLAESFQRDLVSLTLTGTWE